MNALTPRTANMAVASLQHLKQGLQNVASTIVTAGGDPFLRLLRDGHWVFGPSNTEVEAGSLWAVNPLSLMHGFVSWTRHEKGTDEIVGEVMVPMTAALPAQEELRDTGWDWKQQISFVLQCLTGADTGVQVLYKATAIGGLSETKELIAEIMAQLDRDPEKPVPVIELQVDSYQHKKYNKVFTPVFAVQRWMTLDGVELEGPAENEVPQPEAAKPTATRTRTRREPAAGPFETAPGRVADDEAHAQRMAATPTPAAGTTKPVDQMTAEELEALILAKKQQQAALHAVVDPAAARRAELQRQLAELDGTGSQAAPQATGQAEAPAAGQTLRRRRNA